MNKNTPVKISTPDPIESGTYPLARGPGGAKRVHRGDTPNMACPGAGLGGISGRLPKSEKKKLEDGNLKARK